MKAIRLVCALAIGKCAAFSARMLKLGSGSVLAGHIVKKIYPDIYARLSRQAELVVYVTGTNGKTTTTLLLSSIFGKKNTIYNATGANLESGLISALIKETRWGKLRKKTLVLEVDEKVLPMVLNKRAPDLLICLNLFRDQLDRHGETDLIGKAWYNAMRCLPCGTTCILNGDDPALVRLGNSLAQNIVYFGLNEPARGAPRFCHAVDSIYCPFCKTRMEYRTIYLSHLGDFRCPSCPFKRAPPLFDSSKWPSISPYLFSKYNTMSAVTAASLCKIASSRIRDKITRFSPAFGRGEKSRIRGREVLFLLSKNSVSLNESLAIAEEFASQKKLGGLLIALNDHHADGKDISWIWDAELDAVDSLTDNVVVTGTRAYEMALCLNNVSASPFSVNPDFEKQARFALAHCPKGSVLIVIATYTAMLSLRKIFLGRKIL